MKHIYLNDENRIIDTYKELISKTNNKTQEILLLVSNTAKKNKYKRNIKLDYSEEINILTCIEFIRKEIIKYWPVIVEKNKIVNTSEIIPRFINQGVSEYLMSHLVENKRNKENYFNTVISTDMSIAKNITDNMNHAAMNEIDFKEIGERIYNSKHNKENLLRFPYSEMNEVIDIYIYTLLTNSILDTPIMIHIYNEYLLTNNEYIENIKKRFKYILIDDFEKVSKVEIKLIDILNKNNQDTYINMNIDKDFTTFKSGDTDYIDEYLNIESRPRLEIKDFQKLKTAIELDEKSQLYVEMLENICEKVKEILSQGNIYSDIAIITPMNNNIIDYELNRIFKKDSINILNTKKDRYIKENIYINALIVSLAMFYDCENLINRDEHISFIQIILGINKIKATKILDKIENNNRYDDILKYIQLKKKEDINTNEFIIKFYIQYLYNLDNGIENIKICNRMINECEQISSYIDILANKLEKNSKEMIIGILKEVIKDFNNGDEVRKIIESESIILTTPYTYITNEIKRPIQIWVDINNKLWSMNIEKELSNPIIFRDKYNSERIYSREDEEYYKKYYLYNTIYNLMKNSKYIYAYKSEYSIEGYIQENMLYTMMLKILSKEDEYE